MLHDFVDFVKLRSIRASFLQISFHPIHFLWQ